MRKRIILIALLLFSLTISSIVGYAYFRNIEKTSHVLNYASETEELTITNENDFYKYINGYYVVNSELKNEKFNSDELISNASKRFTLILKTDITLKSDITISSDCHINLNGKKIDLNGHSMNIKNYYKGVIVYYGGTIVDSTNSNLNIYIDCPNADVVLPAGIEAKNYNISNEMLANTVMKYIYANIHNYGVNDFYSIVKENTDIMTSYYCPFHGDNYSTIHDGCIYTYTDIVLINNYFNREDIEITYTIEDDENLDIKYSQYLSTSGNILKTISNTDLISVPLTITVSVSGKPLAEKTLNVHIVGSDYYDEAAVATVIGDLNKYVTKDAEGNNIYYTESQFILPTKNNYFNVNFTYSLIDKENVVKAVSGPTSTDYFVTNSDYGQYVFCSLTEIIKYMNVAVENYGVKIPFEGTSSVVVLDDYSYILGIVKEVYQEKLKVVKKTDNSYVVEPEILLKINDTYCHPKLEQYVRLASISYDLKNNDGTYKLEDVNYAEPEKLTDLVQDLKVVTGKEPNITQNVMLDITFTLTNGKVISYPIPIEIADSNATDTGVDNFAQYYNYFNNEFIINTNNYTYHDFEMPLSYGTAKLTYMFRIFETSTAFNELTSTQISGLKEYKVYSGNGPNLFNITIEYPKEDEIVSFSMDNYKCEQLLEAVDSGMARVCVDINQYMIDRNDITYQFVYVPCSIDTVNDELIYGDIITAKNMGTNFYSTLTVTGIVRYTTNTPEITGKTYEVTQTEITEGFDDKLFYDIVYCKYYSVSERPKGYYIVTSDLKGYMKELIIGENRTPNKTPMIDDSGEFILQSYDIVMSDETITKQKIKTQTVSTPYSEISSFKGIELLIGLEALYMSNVRLLVPSDDPLTLLGEDMMDTTQLEYIASLPNLKILDLSYNGLSDRPETYAEDLPFPDGNDNAFVSVLGQMQSLEYLFLNDNHIYSFSGLEDITTLKYVDVSENSFKSVLLQDYYNIELFNIGSTLQSIDNLLTDILENIYGDNGVTNKSIYESIIARDGEVYGYAQSDKNNDIIDKMSSIEYQKFISNKKDADEKYIIDISNVYNQLSTELSEYGIDESYPILKPEAGKMISGNDINGDGDLVDANDIADSYSFEYEKISDTEFKLKLTYYFNYTFSNIYPSVNINENINITYEVKFKVVRI